MSEIFREGGPASLEHFLLLKSIGKIMPLTEIPDLIQRVGGPALLQWHHENNAAATALEYAEKYRDLLVSGLENSQRIYLDTNFWIGLRDASLGRRDGTWCDLLDAIRERVRSRRSICLTQQWSFFEVATQVADSLRATAALVDELCEGIAIAPEHELQFWEVGDYIADRLAIGHHSARGKWTRVGQLLKSDLPTMPSDVSPAGRLAMAKSLMDAVSCATLSDVLAQFGWNTTELLAVRIDDAVIAKVEARKRERRSQNLSRQEVRVFEFASIMRDHYAAHFHEQARRLNLHLGLGVDDVKVKRWSDMLVNAAIEDFRKDRLGTLLPGAAIQAELYTLYERGDLQRPLTTNDWADWQHAAVAVPMCDVFLTEAHLAHQLTKQMGADKRYDCVVVGSVEQALEVLRV